MEPRIKTTVDPDVNAGVQLLFKSIYKAGVSRKTLDLVHLRASQINGCAACVDGGIQTSRKAGVSEEQLHGVVAWREMPYFDDAERAALDLTEAATRLADQPDPVPDEIWDAAAKHYSESELGALVMMIAMTNFFNRLNRTLRVPAGARWD
jgi:AhpD family alkylhydroperoxidase